MIREMSCVLSSGSFRFTLDRILAANRTDIHETVKTRKANMYLSQAHATISFKGTKRVSYHHRILNDDASCDPQNDRSSGVVSQ